MNEFKYLLRSHDICKQHTFVLINKQPTSNIKCFIFWGLLVNLLVKDHVISSIEQILSLYRKTKCMIKKYSFTALSKNECLKNSRGCFFIRSFVETWTQCIDVYYYSPVGLGSAIKKRRGDLSDSLGLILVVIEYQLQYFYMSYKNCFSTPWKTKQKQLASCFIVSFQSSKWCKS